LAGGIAIVVKPITLENLPEIKDGIYTLDDKLFQGGQLALSFAQGDVKCSGEKSLRNMAEQSDRRFAAHCSPSE
jgi:hypothetical protein